MPIYFQLSLRIPSGKLVNFTRRDLWLTVSYSAGNDIAALCPRYITVKRGFFVCAGM